MWLEVRIKGVAGSPCLGVAPAPVPQQALHLEVGERPRQADSIICVTAGAWLVCGFRSCKRGVSCPPSPVKFPKWDDPGLPVLAGL